MSDLDHEVDLALVYAAKGLSRTNVYDALSAHDIYPTEERVTEVLVVINKLLYG